MSSAGLAFRSKISTRVPSSRKRSAIAAPIPAAPPVTMAVLPFNPRMLISPSISRGYYSGCLQLDLAGRVEQVRHEDHAHRRVVAAHQPAPDAAELGARGEVGRLVAAVGGHAADMLRAAA